ncbi:hypothetical protein CDEST_03178 [Colletotrichum destructivum]|uniref:Uncharacterized protein n=1 Tax=Colletotrichum destructivum TaxID=34406 RepID=A0AAX4I4H0_9PEZI|nr:hypothetical protein CDEST_03178 [Colletotrichum destructivum]
MASAPVLAPLSPLIPDRDPPSPHVPFHCTRHKRRTARCGTGQEDEEEGTKALEAQAACSKTHRNGSFPPGPRIAENASGLILNSSKGGGDRGTEGGQAINLLRLQKLSSTSNGADPSLVSRYAREHSYGFQGHCLSQQIDKKKKNIQYECRARS